MPPVVASLVVGDLVRSARDLHPSFDDRRHPDPVLVRALQRYQRELASRIVTIRRDLMTTTLETALPLADFNAGVVLPDYLIPAGVEVDYLGTPGVLLQPTLGVELVPWEERLRYALAAYIRDGALRLTGIATDWIGFSTLRFYYVPQLDPLSGPTDVLVLPNAAESCLIQFLGHLMAKRGSQDPNVSKPDPREYRADWLTAEDRLLDEMARHAQANVSVVREAF